MASKDPFGRLRTELRQQRKARNLKIVDVAQATGVPASRIRRIEEDDGNSPRLVHIIRLATYYGIDPAQIFSLVDISNVRPLPYHSTEDGYD
ncbi:MAG: helix-turn-helix domain-containing protein, partial [Vicinamibacterales bacterium]